MSHSPENAPVTLDKHSKLSDEELVKAILQAEGSDLFGILYDRYANKVYRKCLSFVKDQDQAQDMVQDIFLRVFYQLSKFKGNSRFSTWLYAITYNFCVEHYRKSNRYHTVEIDERIELVDEEAEEKALQSIRADMLKKALEQINPEDKMLLLMKYQDGIPIKEIMTSLELSESAVKMRLARARQRVKAKVQELEKEL